MRRLFVAVLDRSRGAHTRIGRHGRRLDLPGPLKGRNEVPVRTTKAAGNAVFHLSKDGTELSYKLIVANIDNVVAAHIHLGAPGVNGGIVAFLYGAVPAGGGARTVCCPPARSRRPT